MVSTTSASGQDLSGQDLSTTLSLSPLNGPLGTTWDLGVLSRSRTLQESVNSSNPNDFFAFQINTAQSLTVTLSGLSADADLIFLQDANRDSNFTIDERFTSSARSGTQTEQIILNGLAAGTYIIQVAQYTGNTSYTLNLDTAAIDVGDTLSTAAEVGFVTQQRQMSGTLGLNDLNDFYRIRLTQTSDLTLNLSGLTADADLEFIQDLNENNQVDSGETIALSNLFGTNSETIQVRNLVAGQYFVNVSSFLNSSTSYTLSATTDPAGATLTTAQNLDTIAGSRSVTGFVNSLDDTDFYRIRLSTPSQLTIDLDQLTGDANLIFIQDLNQNGQADTNETMAASSNLGVVTERLNLATLAAGTYFVGVRSPLSAASGNANYRLTLNANSVRVNPSVTRLQGTLGADVFTVSAIAPVTVISGNGNIEFGLGARDVLNLMTVNSTSVRFNIYGINGGTGVAYDPGNGTRIFDALTLSDGRQILMEGIEWIQLGDRTLNLAITPNDPLFNQQWNLHMIGAQNAWRFSTGSTSVSIGIQDEGIAFNANGLIHNDLQPTLLDSVNSSNAADDFSSRKTSHGTAVQGIIAANSNNGQGISGLNWASPVFQIDVLGGDLGDRTLVDATQRMIDNAQRQNQRLVINLSLGTKGGAFGENSDEALEVLIQDNPNVLFVIAAGNSGDQSRRGLDSPAVLASRYGNVIAVGASLGTVDRTTGLTVPPGQRADYSQYGPGLTLMAPTEVPTTLAVQTEQGVSFDYYFGMGDRSGSRVLFNGTSAATPHVTGVASLVWSANPTLSAAQVRAILAATTYDLGPSGYDEQYGYGLVNADAAVRQAIALRADAIVPHIA